MKILLAAIPLSTASAAIAAPMLWQNVEVGMTMEQVKALYPPEKDRVKWRTNSARLEGFVELQKCHPDVSISFEKEVVAAITVLSRPRGFPAEICNDAIHPALVAKFGPPSTEHIDDKVGLAGFAYQDIKAIWHRESMNITLEQRTGPNESWSVSYVPIPLASGL